MWSFALFSDASGAALIDKKQSRLLIIRVGLGIQMMDNGWGEIRREKGRC